MDKALKMGKDSATGSFHLFIGKMVSTVILAVGTIILGLLILEGDYGLYAIALIPAATIASFPRLGRRLRHDKILCPVQSHKQGGGRFTYK